jgi:hypothetical protein
MLVDIKTVEAQARKEVNEEASKVAVNALKRKMKQLADAQQIVKNIERELDDIRASITEGSFVG